jgi:hypothetical protein
VSLDSVWFDLVGMEKQTFYWMTRRFSFPGTEPPASPDSLRVKVVMLVEMKAGRDPRSGELDRHSPLRFRRHAAWCSSWTAAGASN